MQHFSNFSSDDGTEKESKGSWARDAAIGGLEGGLAIHLTEPLVNKWTGGATHGAENAAKQTLKQQLISGGKKTAIAAGVGAVSTLAVGAGLNAIGGLLKKKPKPEADPNTQQQAQYSYQGNHFADFAYDPVTKTGFGATKNSFGTQGQTELGQLNRQKLAKVGDDVTHPEYQDHLKQQKQAFDNNRVNSATQGAQAATQAKRAAASEAKRFAGLGVLGKAKNYAGKAFGAIGGVGGLMTASYLAPSILGIFNSGQQQQNQNQEPPY